MSSVRKHYSTDLKVKIVLEILKEEKSVTQLASDHKIHYSQLLKWKKQAVEGLPDLFSDSRTEALKTTHEKEIMALYQEIGQLTTQLAWLKKIRDSLSHADRKNLVDSDCPGLSLSTQSKLLGVSRSGLYYRAVLPSPEEISLRHRIDEIYTRWPFFGSRRIVASLKREGLIVGRERVQTAMREMGIEGIHPGPNLSKRALSHKVYPYLLRNITAQYPHHIWGVDITYIRLAHGWMYLVAIIDWHSRYVVSWELDQTLEMPFVLDCVDRAFKTALPAIFNSDQGSHFTSNSYIERLLSRNIQISMDGKGRAIDNIFTERLWRSIKVVTTCLVAKTHLARIDS